MPSRAEKRAALAALKRQDFETKKVSQVEKILAVPPKTPAQAVKVCAEKSPVAYVAGTSRLSHNMTYAKDREDRAGSWTWGQSREWHPEPGNDHIYGFLDEYKAKTWNEIEAENVGKKKKNDRRNKSYKLGDICDEAYKRLVEIKRDDEERIFRFRISGPERIYGFIKGITFQVLWYDGVHKVCPSKKA